MPRVAAAAEALHLRDRGRAFVEVVAVLGADVAPAAGRRLGLAAEVAGLGRARRPAPRGALRLPPRPAPARGRASRSRGRRCSDCRSAGSPIRPLGRELAEQIIDRLADVLGVRALDRRRAAGDEGGAGQGGHRGRIAAGRPVPERRLALGDPLEPLLDGRFHLGVVSWRPGQRRELRLAGPSRQRRRQGLERLAAG